MNERNIIVELKHTYLQYNNIPHFFNESDNECLICYDKLNFNGLILINNFCECYKVVFLCDRCFMKWFINDNRCFICHIKYQNSNGIKKAVYKINNALIRRKLNSYLNEKKINRNRSIVNPRDARTTRHTGPRDIRSIINAIPIENANVSRSNPIYIRNNVNISLRESVVINNDGTIETPSSLSSSVTSSTSSTVSTASAASIEIDIPNTAESQSNTQLAIHENSLAFKFLSSRYVGLFLYMGMISSFAIVMYYIAGYIKN